MRESTSPKENAPVFETEALYAVIRSDETKENAMTHSTVTRPQTQEKALLNARRDAAFQRFLRDLLSVSPNQGQRFDAATVEGFRHG